MHKNDGSDFLTFKSQRVTKIDHFTRQPMLFFYIGGFFKNVWLGNEYTNPGCTSYSTKTGICLQLLTFNMQKKKKKKQFFERFKK